LRALREASDELGKVPPASNHIPTNIRVVGFRAVAKIHLRAGISTSAEYHARQQAFKRASEYLLGSELVGA
jgi:hypothetical protein